MSNTSPLPKRLKQIRLERCLSQKKLGILAGLDEFSASARINRYEKGVHEPHFGTLKAIANSLHIPVAYFYAEDDSLAKMIFDYNKNEE